MVENCHCIDDDTGVLGAANKILIRVMRFEMEGQKSLEQIIIKKHLLLNSVFNDKKRHKHNRPLTTPSAFPKPLLYRERRVRLPFWVSFPFWVFGLK